jgi:hypothetical protein
LGFERIGHLLPARSKSRVRRFSMSRRKVGVTAPPPRWGHCGRCGASHDVARLPARTRFQEMSMIRATCF